MFCKNVEEITGSKKMDSYPRIISKEIYYDIIPISMLDYNHIISGTIHKVSAVPMSNLSEFDIIFHSNPTAFNKFDIGNVFKSLGWKFKKAFSTKSYKEKLDKKNELFLLVRVAKADGIIEDSEKRVLVDLISNLKEFSNLEKTEFFNLFSLKEMPLIKEDEIVFSTKEGAQTVTQNLKNMMKEDGKIESRGVKLIATLQEKINSNIGNYPSFFSSFFNTWEISVPLIALLVSLFGFSIYFFLFSAKSFNEEIVLDEQIIESIDSTEVSSADPDESFYQNDNLSADFSLDSLETVYISDSTVSLKKGIATVSVERSFFYQNPNISTKEYAYLIEGQDVEFSNRNGDFIYCKFINARGILTEGWMLSADFRNKRPKLEQQKEYKILDPDELSNFPQPIGFLNDFEGVFSDYQKQELNELISNHEKQTGNQIAIVTVPSIAPYDDINTYALELGNLWGVGKKGDNNGVLLVFGKKLRAVSLRVGIGLENKLTNKKSQKILNEIIIPEFKNGEFYLGIKKGILEIINTIVEIQENQ